MELDLGGGDALRLVDFRAGSMLLVVGGGAVLGAGSMLLQGGFLWAGSLVLGRRGQGQKVMGAGGLLPGRTLIVSKAGEKPPGGPRVHEQSLLPHSCGEG